MLVIFILNLAVIILYVIGDIHILFCHEGILGPGEVFQPNHKFVVAGHALGHTFGHALHFLFDYPFKNPRSAPEIRR